MRLWHRLFSTVIVGIAAGLAWSAAAAAQAEFKLTASDATIGDEFGNSVSVSGDYAIVGARFADNGGGSAYIFFRSGPTWTEQAMLTASDASQTDIFGQSVSISGDYAIVGAYLDDDGGSNSGSAYIFSRSDATWTETAKLTASDGAPGDLFGYSVSIASSIYGDYAIVGAVLIAQDNLNTGSAYIFKRSEANPASWSETAKLTASDGAVLDQFGYSVSVSNNYAIVGAEGNDDDGESSGSAYVYDVPTPTIATFSFLTFGDVPLVDGVATDTDSIKIKNTGTADLTVNPQNNMGGGFTVSPAPLTVAPGDSVLLAVGLSAMTVGRKDASLVLDHNDASVGNQTTIAVHANVYEPAEGSVVAWGSNAYGETSVPSGLTEATAIAGGGDHSMALKSDGTVVP